ncbi:hypothetical protein JCM3775_006397 [Rhodotorula graminis]
MSAAAPPPTSSSSPSSSSTTATPSTSTPTTSTAQSSDSSDAADRKRAHRAQKKAEQQARKDERRQFADEHGVDPADLPPSVASALKKGAGPGDAKPKGFLPRKWVDVPARDEDSPVDGASEGKQVAILSWNMLAQALVRRELFPGSDCLKGKDRLPALMEQVLYYDPDIACLQEVDRLAEHLPSLTLSYGYTSFVGYRNKSHGLLIAHKNSVFNKVGERGIRLDDLALDDSELEAQDPPPVEPEVDSQDGDVSAANAADEPEKLTEKEKEIRARPPDASSTSSKASRRAAGLSRATRNVGLFVALEFKDASGRGVVVGTSHTFWHPSHVYERVRQTALLVKELERFRASDDKWHDWPLFLAGDLNTQPREMTYRLLTGASISPDLVADFERSRVVHQSVDKIYDPDYVPPEPPAPEPKEGEDVTSDDLSQHPDRIIKNSRPPTEDDGLATLEQLQHLFRHPDYSSTTTDAAAAAAAPPAAPAERRRVRSAYGESYGLVPSESQRWYCARKPEVQMGNGWRVAEPEADVAARLEGSWAERVERGDFEPLYSNFTPLWRCTLDYILLLPPSPSPSTSTSTSPAARPQPRWRKLLEMHDFHETCEPGLPRKGVEPSDHVAVATVVEVY